MTIAPDTPAFLSEREVAQRWGLGRSTVTAMRQERRGPKYVKLGGTVRYRLSDVIEFEEENLHA